MKTNRIFAAFVILMTGIFLTSCININEPKLPSTPQALAAYDHSSAGIVKGVLVGSSGVFKFSIKNGNDSVYCLVTFDGATGMLLPTTDMSSWNPGDAFAATFSGTVGGTNVSVYFKCNNDGTSPSASFTIPGHNVSVSLYKETSTLIVKGYEGTYINYDVATNKEIDHGTFNFVEYNGNVAGTHSGTDGSGSFTGTVANGKLTIDNGQLDITDTSVSGTVLHSENNSEKLVVTGKRTL